MTFEFQLLGLLLVFMLMMTYFNKNENFKKGNKLFMGIVLTTYIIEFIGMLIYVLTENGISSNGYNILYNSLIFIWFSLYGGYFFVKYLKGILKDNLKVNNIISKYKLFYYIFILLGIVTTFIMPLNKLGEFRIPNILNIFIIIYLVIELLILILGFKKIDKRTYINLGGIYLITIFFYLLQGRSPEIPFLNIGMILVLYFNYLILENNDREVLKNVILERDQAKRQCIDKSDFLKVLSHEIRIPLNTIEGFSQIILDSDSIDEIKTDIKDIRSASKDLIDVINGMIDLSIIESGSLEIIDENYNVYDMFNDIKNIAESKMKDKNVQFKLEVDDDIPEVLLGDSERISQIILNLLTNAIKYTDKGNITLKVSCVKGSTKCRLKIIVSDTGRGIRKEDIDNIFDEKIRRGGASLGLAISKYLLELMGGSIEAESTFGTGSNFIVTLDQKVIDDVTGEKISRKRVLKPFDTNGKRILLVDDNKLNLKVAMKLLQPYNVEVIEATSGRECLDLLEKSTNYDLILMDDMMPEMSGTEALGILKKIERVDGFYVPVVVLTANATTGMKEKYLNVGFEDYLAKPIDKYELDRILKKYLKGKKN